MRTNKYILLAATLLGLSSCGNKRGDYDASGTFEATEVIVSSEANGKIMQFNIEERTVIKGRGRSGVHRYLTTLFEKDAVTGQR
mgnify:CR=1 FL=1